MALLTYQILYWGWLKLEDIETRHDKEAQIKSLEGEVERLVEKGKAAVEGKS